MKVADVGDSVIAYKALKERAEDVANDLCRMRDRSTDYFCGSEKGYAENVIEGFELLLAKLKQDLAALGEQEIGG